MPGTSWRQAPGGPIDAEHGDRVGSLIAGDEKAPEGSMPKPRGVEPPVATVSTNVNRPLDWSMVNTAMLSCPRLEPYRNFPDGCTSTSAVL